MHTLVVHCLGKRDGRKSQYRSQHFRIEHKFCLSGDHQRNRYQYSDVCIFL